MLRELLARLLCPTRPAIKRNLSAEADALRKRAATALFWDDWLAIEHIRDEVRALLADAHKAENINVFRACHSILKHLEDYS